MALSYLNLEKSVAINPKANFFALTKTKGNKIYYFLSELKAAVKPLNEIGTSITFC